MENIFEPATSDAILKRLENLKPGTTAQWGKMNVSQMLAHCQVPMEVGLGERSLKQGLMGKLFGRIAKRQLLSDAPIKKNLPTDPSFLVKDERNFEKEKQLLHSLIDRFANADAVAIAQKPHPFFGVMTSDEWGKLMWKHLDHHFKQFGA